MKKAVLISALISLVFLSSCGNDESKEETALTQSGSESISEGNNSSSAQMLPSFNMRDIDGRLLNLKSFEGKKVFVNLWASWCPPCRREMPSIQKLYQGLDKNKVVFVMLALDDDFNKSKQYILEQGFMMPVYHPGENLPELFNVQGIPATFIFDEKGALIEKVEGSDDYSKAKYKDLLN